MWTTTKRTLHHGWVSGSEDYYFTVAFPFTIAQNNEYIKKIVLEKDNQLHSGQKKKDIQTILLLSFKN